MTVSSAVGTGAKVVGGVALVAFIAAAYSTGMAPAIHGAAALGAKAVAGTGHAVGALGEKALELL